MQIIVADGGSQDGTLDVARHAGAIVCEAPRGRASQLNAGARLATGAWLAFLHADIRLPPEAGRGLLQAMQDPSVAAAVWRLRIDARGAWYRVIEFGASLRDRLGGLPYGDQGLLIRRTLFQTIGGYPDLPIMEDVAMIRAVRRQEPIRRLRSALLVSARRWQREGPVRSWLRNVGLLSAFLAGVSPARLTRFYRAESPPT